MQYSSLDGVQPEELCQEFDLVASCFHSVSIIVDGLDECEDPNQVTRHLAGLCSTGSRVRFLFFSRDVEVIEKTLLDKHNFEVQSVAADNGDIKRYVDTEVERRTNEGELQAEDESLKTRIRERLIEGSKGMYVLHPGLGRYSFNISQ